MFVASQFGIRATTTIKVFGGEQLLGSDTRTRKGGCPVGVEARYRTRLQLVRVDIALTVYSGYSTRNR